MRIKSLDEMDKLPRYVVGTHNVQYTLNIDRPKSNGYKWRVYYKAPSYGKLHLVEDANLGEAIRLLRSGLTQQEDI